jgi:hypothetical protein
MSVRYLDRSGHWTRYDGRKALRPVVFARDPITGREKAIHYARERRGTSYAPRMERRVRREYTAAVEKKLEPEVRVRGRGPWNYVAVQYQVTRHDSPGKLARDGFRPKEKVWVSARIEARTSDAARETAKSLADYYLGVMERKGYNRTLAPVRAVVRRVSPERFSATADVARKRKRKREKRGYAYHKGRA